MARVAPVLLLLVACTAGPPGEPVPGAARMRLEAEPGPRPPESPPVWKMWREAADAWVITDRVIDVAPGGGAYVDAQGRRVAGRPPRERPLDGDVIPGLSVGPDGTVYYARSPQPPATDVWKVAPGGRPERVTSDGRSDRPVALPDGSLLWISSAPDGVAGWVRDGRKITHGLAVPVPAFPRKTRLEEERVVYDAGDAEWTLDPRTGEAHRR